jgi:hypothetical protein
LEFIVSQLRSDTEKCNLIDLVRDQFGNYVIQSCLDNSGPEQRELVIAKLVEAAPLIKRHNQHSRHVYNHLDKKHQVKVRTKPLGREESKASSVSSCSYQSSANGYAMAPQKTLGGPAPLVYARPPQEEDEEEKKQYKVKVKVSRRRGKKHSLATQDPPS